MGDRRHITPVGVRLMHKTFVHGECWEWTGSQSEKGYGRIGVWRQGRMVTESTHRAAYEAYVGPIPDGMQVLHTCDNPPCIRPSHLYLGTHADNMRDRSERGHTVNPPKCHGERNGYTTLTQEDVDNIRVMLSYGTKQRDVAKVFGVAHSTISRIKNEKTWASRWTRREEG